jgi:hypothetical protein
VTELVYFGSGQPRKVVRLEGEYLEWAGSGKAFAIVESQGISFYEYAGGGQIHKVLETTGPRGESWGSWTVGDVFVMATRSTSTTLATLTRVARDDGGAWEAMRLIETDEVWSFEVSPNGMEVMYEDEGSELAVLPIAPGATPKALAPADDYSFMWSPDGSQFLLIDHTDVSFGRAFWGTGLAYEQEPVRIAASLDVLWAGFTADGRQVMLAQPVDEWGMDVDLLDPAKRTDYTQDTIGRAGRTDGSPVFAHDKDTGVMPIRGDADDPIELQLFTLSHQGSDRFDSIPASSAYRSIQFGADDKFLAYRKGVRDDFDGAYVDLRYGYPKPVRIPGEGNLYGLKFDASGTGLYYVREKPNGARECFYLDLSRQVAAEPVKVSRDGRVDTWAVQPLPN